MYTTTCQGHAAPRSVRTPYTWRPDRQIQKAELLNQLSFLGEGGGKGGRRLMEKEGRNGEQPSPWLRRASAARPHHLSQTMEYCPDHGIVSKHLPGGRNPAGAVSSCSGGLPAQHTTCSPRHPNAGMVQRSSPLLQSENDRMIKTTAVIQDSAEPICNFLHCTEYAKETR